MHAWPQYDISMLTLDNECSLPSVSSCSLSYYPSACPPSLSSLPSVSSLSSISPVDIAAAWRWCPCECLSSSLPSLSRGCPATDVCDTLFTGEGTWEFLAGRADLGPPCVVGQYYGQVSFIMLCPTYGECVPSSSASIPGGGSCDDVLVQWPPANWRLDWMGCDKPPRPRIPERVVASVDVPYGLGLWTWCPCKGSYNGYPDDGSPVSCPFPGSSCDTGDGHWVFRGGDDTAPIPCDAGQFYGETVATKQCCPQSLSSSSSSLSSRSSIPSSLSCDIPDLPNFDTWFAGLAELVEGFEDIDSGCVPATISDLIAECNGWVWCPCDCVDYELPTIAGDCPQTVTCQSSTDGHWVPLSDTGPTPCVTGRFFGEVQWLCPCPVCSSSSVSSGSSGSSAGLPFATPFLFTANLLDEIVPFDPDGIFDNFVAWEELQL